MVLVDLIALFWPLVLLNLFSLKVLVFGKFFTALQPSEGEYNHLYPVTCLAVNAKSNYDHVLPTFFGMVESLRYPKNRMHIQLFTESYGSNPLLNIWLRNLPSRLYLSSTAYSLETIGHGNWRESALRISRDQLRCSFLLLLSTTDLLANEHSLKILINEVDVVVSPLLDPLLQSSLDSCNSNFKEILDDEFCRREKSDQLVRVYYARGPLLINITHPDASYLTFDSDNIGQPFSEQIPQINSIKNVDDEPISTFAHSAFTMNIPVMATNRHFYGYYALGSDRMDLVKHRAYFGAFLAEAISFRGFHPFPESSLLPAWYPTKTRHGFDKIYLINLDRRVERLAKSTEIFRHIGIEFDRFPAIDGANLTQQQLSSMGLRFLSDYQDPFHKRPLKKGELGCLLSHYEVWKDVVKNRFERVIVFEDDIRFSADSRGTLLLDAVVEDLVRTRFSWDLIYLGRKRMCSANKELFIPGHRYLSSVCYSYWTIGYALSLRGAEKLISAGLLQNVLALDEFLPILYDSNYPHKNWAKHFASHSIRAYAVYPPIVEPDRYTNQLGYVSDTESSEVIFTGNQFSGTELKGSDDTQESIADYRSQKIDNAKFSDEL